MFTWDKTIERIDAPADQVLNLFRSMRDVQLALPGQSVQEASAYLCQVLTDKSAATYAVFHLHKSGQLAFYVSDPRQVPESKIELMLDKGLNFVESMGFLLTDMDLNLLSEQDREMLWNSLPLAAGVPSAADREPPAEVQSAPAGKPVEEPPAEPPSPEPEAAAAVSAEPAKSAPAAPAAAAPTSEPTVATAAEPDRLPADAAEQDEESVDDLLAAVEALRAKRPGLQPRRKAPKPAEIRKRRDELRQIIGRLLASL